MKMSLPKFERDSRRWGRVNALVALNIYELEIFIWILERGKIHKSLHGVITFPPLQPLTFLPFSKGDSLFGEAVYTGWCPRSSSRSVAL